MTEIIVLVIILLQFGYMVYSDIQNRKERKFIQMNVEDFTDFEELPEDSIEEEDPYISADEAGIEQIVKAKETE